VIARRDDRERVHCARSAHARQSAMANLILTTGAVPRASAGVQLWLTTSPEGRYLVEPVYDEPRVLVAELDLGRVCEESMTLDVTGHYHRPELFDFRVLRSGRRPAGEGGRQD